MPAETVQDANAPVLYRVEDGVAVISFNAPEKHNAINGRMATAYLNYWRQAQDDPQVRAIVIRGEGRSFCSGKDVTELGSRAPGVSNYAHVRNSQKRKFEALDSPKPIVAAVKGYAIGGGCEYALQADIRVAGESARFGLPEINHGIMTDGGGTSITAAIAGPARAKYMVMTGDLVDAHTAMQWGLIDFLLPDEEVDAKALDIAKKIAAQPPVHIQVAKRLCDAVHGDGVRRGIQEELLAIALLYSTQDRQEVLAARRESRKPKFTGL
jgi:enoyl-CoA hydratase/carnithine racemase